MSSPRNANVLDSNLPSNWVIIFDWPGLDKIYPVKITRHISENTIITQFGDHTLHCPTFMDKVLLSLKTKALGYDADYDFFLGMVLKCLQSPKLFSVNEWLNFEDFIINEYCKHLLDKYCTENSVQGPCSKIKKTK